MKTLLSIQSSLFVEHGISRRLTEEFIAQWRRDNPRGRVVVRDLAADPIPHLTAERFTAFGGGDGLDAGQLAALADSDEMIAELEEADEVVLGLPMYNFTLPSTLKAYFDHIARAGVTFRYTETGPEGLLGDRPVHVFATRGGYYQGTSADTQTDLVKLFFGLLGINDMRFIYAEGLAMGEAQQAAAMQQAREAFQQRKAA